jgi:hypothetical protein
MNGYVPATPSADPMMWAGSLLAQQEAADIIAAYRGDDINMVDEEYLASHQEYEQAGAETRRSDVVSVLCGVVRR